MTAKLVSISVGWAKLGDKVYLDKNCTIGATVIASLKNPISMLLGWIENDFWAVNNVLFSQGLTPRETAKFRSAYYDNFSSEVNNILNYTKSVWLAPTREVYVLNNDVAQDTSNLDLDDWRKWRTIEPGHCACGIIKDMCSYHKD